MPEPAAIVIAIAFIAFIALLGYLAQSVASKKGKPK